MNCLHLALMQMLSAAAQVPLGAAALLQRVVVAVPPPPLGAAAVLPALPLGAAAVLPALPLGAAVVPHQTADAASGVEAAVIAVMMAQDGVTSQLRIASSVLAPSMPAHGHHLAVRLCL
jgi:hypothetical protein